jgi:hypothetical protein
MTATIEILENGRPLETRELADGSYVIGRDSSADIVLNGKTVSKSHATLIIDGNQIRIVDNGSANGIYSRSEKISDKTFKNAFQIELAPFSIRTKGMAQAAGESEKKAAMAGAFGSLLNRNLKIVFSFVTVLAMLLCLVIVYSPLKRNADAIYRAAYLDRGVLLGRYLAEINRPFLETGEHAWIRTTPVRDEKGVAYAFVVDGYGKIIAPHEQQGDFFNWDGLPQALKDARPLVGSGPGGEHLIFSPVVFRNQVQGAAIIGFANLNGKPAPGAGLAGGTIFLLLLLFGLAVIISYFLTENFLTPLRLLYEDIEIAVKEGRDHIGFKAPYEELDNIKRIVNRLLLRKTGDPGQPETAGGTPAAKVIPPPEPAPAAATPAGPKEPPPAPPGKGPSIEGPWCLVDKEDYTLMRFSDTFTRDLALKECRPGMHIIEAFDSEIILIVTQIIETPEGTTLELEAGGRQYMVSGTGQNTDKPSVLIVFEEKGS